MKFNREILEDLHEKLSDALDAAEEILGVLPDGCEVELRDDPDLGRNSHSYRSPSRRYPLLPLGKELVKLNESLADIEEAYADMNGD